MELELKLELLLLLLLLAPEGRAATAGQISRNILAIISDPIFDQTMSLEFNTP